jgi:hypothetical protein
MFARSGCAILPLRNQALSYNVPSPCWYNCTLYLSHHIFRLTPHEDCRSRNRMGSFKKRAAQAKSRIPGCTHRLRYPCLSGMTQDHQISFKRGKQMRMTDALKSPIGLGRKAKPLLWRSAPSLVMLCARPDDVTCSIKVGAQETLHRIPSTRHSHCHTAKSRSIVAAKLSARAFAKYDRISEASCNY